MKPRAGAQENLINGVPSLPRQTISDGLRCASKALKPKVDINMAAPAKIASAGLGKPIAFRLTETDREEYLKKVAATGLTQSEFFRQAILTNTTSVVAKTGASPDYRKLLYIANTANMKINAIAEMAHSYHQKDTLSESMFSQILDELDTISRYMKHSLSQAA